MSSGLRFRRTFLILIDTCNEKFRVAIKSTNRSGDTDAQVPVMACCIRKNGDSSGVPLIDAPALTQSVETDSADQYDTVQ